MTRSVGFLAVVVASLVLTCVAQTAQAQGRSRRGGSGGAGFMGGSASALLQQEAVQKELELNDDQIQELKTLASGQRDTFMKVFRENRNMSREERTELFRKIRNDLQEKVDGILLPHQSRRLKQLALQVRMRGGVTSALFSEEVTKELNITDAQRDKLEATRTELEKELRDKIVKLRKEAQDKLLETLTPPQREAFKKMVGEPFDFPQPASRGGRGGGPRR